MKKLTSFLTAMAFSIILLGTSTCFAQDDDLGPKIPDCGPQTNVYSSYLCDINGQRVEIGKQYYLVAAGSPHQGLTFEKSTFWDYVRLSQSNDTSKIDGTPVKLSTNKPLDVNNPYINKHDRVYFEMDGRYFSFGKTNTWLWLSGENRKASAEAVQNDGDKQICFKVDSATYYFDKFGKPCDWYSAAYSESGDTYFELSSTDASGTWTDQSGKKWVLPYKHTEANADKFYLVPVNK